MVRDKLTAKRKGDPVAMPQSLFHDMIKRDQISETEAGKVKHTKKRRRADDDALEQIVDKKQARKIFKQARAQIEEETEASGNVKKTGKLPVGTPDNMEQSVLSEETFEDTADSVMHGFPITDEQQHEELCLGEDDRRAIDAFFYDEEDSDKTYDDSANLEQNFDTDAASKLSDILKEKHTELQSLIGDRNRASADEVEQDFEKWKLTQSEQVLALYSKVRDVLARYRSGKLPKAFKIVPALGDSTWRHFLELLEPTKWTARAMYEATRLFASNLNEHRAEKFYREYLLPRIRDDIKEYGKLNSHLFAALRRAVYKPGAFVKGILFPLLALDTDLRSLVPAPQPNCLQMGNSTNSSNNTNTDIMGCTNREAYVFAAVLSRLSVPMLHAAAACVKIVKVFLQTVQTSDITSATTSEFFQHSIGPFSLILRAIIEKRYALPFRVLAALTDWFVLVHSFVVASSKRKRTASTLTVVWFQCLLAFVERYASQLTSEQLSALIEVTEPGASCSHKLITPAVRRVLLNAMQHAE